MSKTAFLFISLFVFISCQIIKTTQVDHSIIPLGGDESLKFPSEITEFQIQEDVKYLIKILEHAYAGKKYIKPQVFEKVISELKMISGKLSMSEFHQKIDEALFQLPDNHLMAYYKGRVAKSRQDEFEVKGRVGKKDKVASDKIWHLKILKKKTKKILYLSIKDFPHYESREWDGLMDEFKNNLKESHTLIIDFRGTGGGDDTIGMEIVEHIFGHPFEHPISIQYKFQTPEVLALQINNIMVDKINNNGKLSNFQENSLLNLKEKYQQALEKKLPEVYGRINKGGGLRLTPVTGFNKPIFILTDKKCGSSCEFTAAGLFWHPKTRRVGENTNGTFHFSNAGLAILPHSRFKIIVPSQYNEFFDKRNIERIGLVPDIRVPSGTDALQFTLSNLIR